MPIRPGCPTVAPRPARLLLLARLLVVAATATATTCATPRTTCLSGTTLARRIYSGGGEAEWCRRPDGVRQGPETRIYESGAELLTGGYVDGAQSGVWRYRFNDGSNWRADRWEDGALVERVVDPRVAGMTAAELRALGPTTSGIIKLAARDPSGPASRPADTTAGPADAAAVVRRFPNGRPSVAGSYDAEGLRTGVWRFWFEDGRPAREIGFWSGVRERGAREWYTNGAIAVEGTYTAGERDGRWRFWNARGEPTAEISYQAGVGQSASPNDSAVGAVGGGMLPTGPRR